MNDRAEGAQEGFARVQDEAWWQCDSCGEILQGKDMLSAPNPFDPEDVLVGCPKCKQADQGWTSICDEPGCRKPATCGSPSKSGYRRTCYRHRPKE